MAKRAPKKSKRLHLIHHRHTAKLLHRRHTSYPLLAFLLLKVGVLLSAMTLQAYAVTVDVTAVNLGEPPTSPAIITNPEDGDRFTSSPINVSGTCQAGFYVKLLRNNIFSGSGVCGADGTFVIATSLFKGKNDLEARIYNIADNEGPRSGKISVYLDDSSVSPPPSEAVFYLSTDYFYMAAYTGQEIVWEFDIYGGEKPYSVVVDWGDGTTSTHAASGNKLKISHTYNLLKDVRRHYVVSVKVTDSEGNVTSLQLIAILNQPEIIGGALVRPGTPSPGAGLFDGMLRYVWSAYAIALLMGVSFWLGERRGEGIKWNKLRSLRSP